MYSSILVGTDGSESAARAVATAVGLAQATGARLHVLTVAKPITAAWAPEVAGLAADPNWKDAAEREMQACLDRVVDQAKEVGVTADTHLAFGSPADVLCDLAQELEVGLMVVGNKGMTGARRFLLGSVPNVVSHHAPCDVLIVRTT